ncbi:MAG: hypothetical protein WCU88_08840 [Elusimicrobiota bacterium]|jgi:hypothetical protein
MKRTTILIAMLLLAACRESAFAGSGNLFLQPRLSDAAETTGRSALLDYCKFHMTLPLDVWNIPLGASAKISIRKLSAQASPGTGWALDTVSGRLVWKFS